MGNPKAYATRGLRQGNPLSPYLFLICVEGLSTLLRKLTELGTLKGVSTCARRPDISHLFFVNDSLIFCQVTKEECFSLISILKKYGQASGQQLNQEKTSLFFCKNTPQEVQEDIKSCFGAEIVKQHEKYLGLLSLVGKNKCNTFHWLIERLNNKLSEWKEK